MGKEVAATVVAASLLDRVDGATPEDPCGSRDLELHMPHRTSDELQRLESIHEDDPFWDHLDVFVDRLRALGDRKLSDRHQAEREAAKAVSDALAQLAPEMEPQLAYLKRTLPSPPERLDAERSAVALEAIERVRGATRRLAAARALVAATIDDEDALAEGRRQAHAAVLLDLGALSDCLAQATSDTPSIPGVDSPLEPEAVAEPPGPPDASTPGEDSPCEPEAVAEPPPPPDATATMSSESGPPSASAAESRSVAPFASPDLPAAQPRPDAVGSGQADAPAAPTSPIRHATSEPESPAPTEPLASRLAPAAPQASEPDASVIWTLLARGDEAGAYWAARAASAIGEQPPLEEEVLAVLLASRWLDPARGAFVGEVVDLVTGVDARERSWASSAVATAAALVPTLTFPSTKLRGWAADGVDAAIDPVVDAVTAFADGAGQPLTQLLLQGAGDASEQDSRARAVEARVRRWLDEGPKRSMMYQPATKVWATMFRVDFEPTLDRIARGDTGALALAEGVRERMSSPREVDARIRELDRELRGNHAQEIQFGARTALERAIAHTVALIDDWARIVRESEQLRRLDWLTARVADLRRRVLDALPLALGWAESLARDPSSERAAVGTVVWRSLSLLADLLRIGPAAGPPVTVLGGPDLGRLVRDQERLQDALGTRLLFCPPARTPASAGVTEPRRLLDALMRTPPINEVVEQWVSDGAFDEVERLFPLVSDELRERVEKKLAISRLELERTADGLRAAVEQGVIDGYVGDERAELSSKIDGLRPRDTRDLARIREVLAEVRGRLDELREKRADRALAEWAELERTMADSGTASEVIARWRALVHGARDRGDVRILDERLSDLRDRIGPGFSAEPPPVSETATPRIIDSFRALCASADSQPEHFALPRLRDHIRLHGAVTPEFGVIAADERDEVLALLGAWAQLSQRGLRQSRPTVSAQALAILQFIGFDPVGAEPIRFDTVSANTSWLVLRAQDGGRCPVPQFGSRTQGEYRVLCVWGSPSPDAVGRIAASAAHGGQALITLYLGRLTSAQRGSLRSVCRHHNQTMMCVDETLLVFLLGCGENRLRALFECALPFSLVNPYVPQGEVPPEMYFGRRALVEELLRPEGSCIVYGGRQLGKSALLREVRRRFHHPEREQYAIVLDVLSIGDHRAGRDVGTVWQILRDRLREAGVLETKKTRPEEIVSTIREHLGRHPKMRLTVLLDEADNLLDADARDGFQVVAAFRELMGDTERRFRVVLAGLHNVQRFQQLPNQPLAHFGAAIQVGPLEPRDATALVRQPVEALGFVFDDDDDVLRILSYTNYHPGLIQLFCHELLKQMQTEAAPRPPVSITRQHVDKVYQQPHVRKGILDRFDWTLALDPRYQAVAWTVIVENKDCYTPAELLSAVRSWWANGFASTGTEEFRGLLDEMVGLGVLVGSTERGFRLRSPNVVQLMGQVEPRLIELASKEPPTVFDVDRLHRLTSREVYSPLTFGQERQLLARRWGVALVFASRAQGVDALLPALRDLEDTSHIPILESPVDLVAERLEDWLRDAQERIQDGLFIAFVRAPSDAALARALVDEARRYCAKRGASKNLFGRLVFVFDGPSAAAWIASPEREAVEAQVDVVMWPHKWSRVGLKARLHQQELRDHDAQVERLHEVTGGWGLLVERAFELSGGHHGRQDAYDRRLEDLATDATGLAGFLAAAGLPSGAPGRALLEVLFGLLGSSSEPVANLSAPLFVDDLPWIDELSLANCLVFLVRLGLVEQGESAKGTTIRVDPVAAASLGP